MDAYQISQKVAFGYAKAASKLGLPFELYRSATPINPIDPSNLIGTIPGNMTVSWDYMKGNRPGNPIWLALIDGQDASYPLTAEENDYLVGYKTFYVMSKEPDLPIQVVECNRTISIARPSQRTGPGYIGYVGSTPGSSEQVMLNMPVSCLRKGTTENAPTKLPTDTKQPTWEIMMPNIGGVNVRLDDIVTDEINQEYVVLSNEETEFGWRLMAQQVVNSR